MPNSNPGMHRRAPRAWRRGLFLAGLSSLLFLFSRLGHEAWVDEPNGFDTLVHRWVVGHRADWAGLTVFFRVVTRFGNPEGAVPATVAVGFGLYALGRRGVAGLRKADACLWLLVILGGRYLGMAMKRVFARERPPVDHRLVAETSYSFPSGHSVFASVFFTLLAIYLVRMIPSSRRWLRLGVVLACFLSAVTVAGSRIWLGVHYPTDVIGGLLLGVTWVFTAWVIRMERGRWRETTPRRREDPA